MKKIFQFIGFITLMTLFTGFHPSFSAGTEDPQPSKQSTPGYSYPEFYRGIYLTNPSGKNIDKLKTFAALARKAGLNTMVIDAQPAPQSRTSIPKENVSFLIQNGIHPIARIVCFTDGLKEFPIPESVLADRINIAKSACEVGFREIQFDYIRFNDSAILARVPLQKKYDFIEGFLIRARNELKQYNVRIAADIFGRIPLNTGDAIGQRMEGLDKVLDIICPMAYPSHYTWSEKMMKDPYYTVFLTSSRAKERTKQAEIVSYIQAFKMKVTKSGLSYDEYVRQQVKAVHDAKIKGYILWNAAQDYEIPFKVTEEFYREQKQATDTRRKQGGSAL
jgi:hypothetical protein